ncbi:T9SS type A sorting domain-containing protein [candidate division KSB1 bacterium]
MSTRFKINLCLLFSFLLLCITPFAVSSQSDDQNSRFTSHTFNKTADIFDRAIGSLDKGKMLFRNFENYGMIGYTGPSSRHGLWGELRWFLFMLGMPPGPWGASVQTEDLGVIDRSDQYNVIENYTCRLAANDPGEEFSDWEAKDGSATRLFGSARNASNYPLIASSDNEDTWPQGYYDQSGNWTDTPGERHWPGPWALDADPASPTYLQENYGQFVSDKDMFYIFDDKYNGIRSGYDLGIGYPVGIDVEVTGYSWAVPAYEDIAFLKYDIIFRDDIASEDQERQFYDGPIDDVYFGFYTDVDIPGRDSLNQWCDPWAIDDFALPDKDNNALIMFDKRGWTEDLNTGNDQQQGPVSVYSIAFTKTPEDIGITDFHFLDQELIMSYDGGPYFEKIMYSFLSSNPGLIDSETDRNVVFHVSPSDVDYPHFDQVDSLLRYNEYDYYGNPYPTFYHNDAYNRPDISFSIGIGPITLTPGSTYPLHFTIFGSEDNPAVLDPDYYHFPVNTPYLNSSGFTDMTDRFADVYDNLSRARTLYENHFGGHIVNLQTLNSGETVNGNVQVEWNVSSLTGNPIYAVDIFFSSDAGTKWETIAENISNSGSYQWNTLFVPDGIYYRIKIVAEDSLLIGTAASDTDFTVNNPGDAPPQIRLLDPLYTMTATGATDIEWHAGDADGDAVTISISYSKDGGLTWDAIASDLTNTGAYSWDSADSPNSPYGNLRLIVNDGALADTVETGYIITVDNPRETLSSTLFDHPAGYGNGSAEVRIIDESALTGHLYEITFNETVDSLNTYYSIKDLNTGSTVINEMLYNTAESREFDGVRLYIDEHDELEQLNAGWKTGGDTWWTLTDLGSRSNSIPGYYEFRYFETPADSHYNGTVKTDQALPFQIWNMAAVPKPFQVLIKSTKDGIKAWNYRQTFYFYEPQPGDPSGSPVKTWSTMLFHPDSGDVQSIDTTVTPPDTIFWEPNDPQPGDVHVWETTIPFTEADTLRFSLDLTDVKEEKVLPNTFRLHQNYPNPFNPETTIRFELPAAADVRITVYNILGKEVAKVTDRDYAAGEHSIKWNGRNSFGTQVSSGMYFYRIEAGTFVKTMKMVLLR